MSENISQVLAEVYPIQKDSLPELTAYNVEVGSGKSYLVGGKLAYRLIKRHGGHWVWADYRIITDFAATQSDIDSGDQIAGLALNRVKPKNLEGSIPYWL